MKPAKYIFIAFVATQLASVSFAERPNILLILADDLGYSDLGCYGGEISTPHLDALAEQGLRLTQLYNAARCCSTRASLLTGLYPHQAGVGAMSADNGLPGYRGFLNDQCVTIPSLLRENDYRTYMSGKWHLRGKGNPDCTPSNRGFDEFYGHFKAYASFYRQDLFVRRPNNRPTRQYEDFYATDAITDYAIDFIQDARTDERPFFLYVAYNAPHFPLQAPKAAIDAYVETYQVGWDKIRQSRFERMVKRGILKADAQLSPRGIVTKVPNRNRNSPYYGQQIPEWDTLDEDRRRDLARRMATYAAMVEIMDRNIGRMIDELREANELDNTLIVFLSDNGACAEWDPFGFDNAPYPQNRLYQGAELDLIGQPKTFHSYGTGWANACNTPFRLYKHYNHEGGISAPCILHWPAQLKRTGEIDRTPAHVIDFAATILPLTETAYPRTHDGREILPLEGRNLLPILSGEAEGERPLFFEHEGNRGVRRGKWKLAWTNFDQRWQLYDIEADRSELNDLAFENPVKIAELSHLWVKWAERCNVEKQRVPQPATGMPKIYYWEE